jgi:hypothetical protein
MSFHILKKKKKDSEEGTKMRDGTLIIKNQEPEL